MSFALRSPSSRPAPCARAVGGQRVPAGLVPAPSETGVAVPADAAPADAAPSDAVPSDTLPAAWKLPLRWAPRPLQAELAPLLAGMGGALRPGLQGRGHRGAWQGLELLPAAMTQTLAACPLLREVLACLPGDLQAARLLALAPGAEGRQGAQRVAARVAAGSPRGDHPRQQPLVVRFQVLLQSAPQALWHIDGQPLAMAEGECWCLDPRRPQRIVNTGSVSRLHLEADCRVNTLLRRLLPMG